MAKCPDCKGRKVIALLNRVVDCTLCGATGEVNTPGMMPDKITLGGVEIEYMEQLGKLHDDMQDAWAGKSWPGPKTGRMNPIPPPPVTCSCFDCGVGLHSGNAYVLPSMPGEHFCQTHYNVRANTHPGALHPPKSPPPLARPGVIPCYNDKCKFNVPPGVCITHSAYPVGTGFCSQQCCLDKFQRDSAAGAFPP